MTIAFGLSGSLADTLANRPTPDPDKIGRFFLDTDAGTLYRDGGTAWLRVRDDATDRPRAGSLIIQANDANALQVCKLVQHDVVEFSHEISDLYNMLDGYEGLTGISFEHSDDGDLYMQVVSNQQNPPLWKIYIYSDAGRNWLIGVSGWNATGQTVAITESGESGLGGTLDLTATTEAPEGDTIRARWTITQEASPVEVFNVNTLTGAVALPAGTAEPPLGNPDATGKVLTSTPEGLRSWITQSGGGGGNPDSFRAWLTYNFSTPNAQVSRVPFDRLVYATNSLWNANTFDWHPPAGKTVHLHFCARILSAGYFQIIIQKNGSNLTMAQIDSGTGALSISATDVVAEGDAFSCAIWRWDNGFLEANGSNCMVFFEGMTL